MFGDLPRTTPRDSFFERKLCSRKLAQPFCLVLAHGHAVERCTAKPKNTYSVGIMNKRTRVAVFAEFCFENLDAEHILQKRNNIDDVDRISAFFCQILRAASFTMYNVAKSLEDMFDTMAKLRKLGTS